MKRRLLKVCTVFFFCAAVFLGCGSTDDTAENKETDAESLYTAETECTEIPVYVPASESNTETVYAETADDEKLADFLIDYYAVPEEYRKTTRYYYNRIDLNGDGEDEMFAVVVGEYTECDGGDPAVILSVGKNGYEVLESFAYIRTPVYISESQTDGWHDIIFPTYGGGEGTGYKICRYLAESGYQQPERTEYVSEFEDGFRGKKILANNFIDDMDKGNYLMLENTDETEQGETQN